MKIKGNINEQADHKLLEILDRTRRSKREEDQDLFFYALKEVESRMDKYKKYYIEARHYYVADKDNIDLCVVCGKDFRNDIHLRVSGSVICICPNCKKEYTDYHEAMRCCY